MRNQKWRDQFIAAATRRGLCVEDCAAILRAAGTLHAIAERQCNGYQDDEQTIRGEDAIEFHDETRGGPYIARERHGVEELTAEQARALPAEERRRVCVQATWQEFRDWQRERSAMKRVRAILAEHAKREKPRNRLVAEFQGDPRGAVVKLYPAKLSAEERDRSSDYIAVP